jgi:hypothetical protein
LQINQPLCRYILTGSRVEKLLVEETNVDILRLSNFDRHHVQKSSSQITIESGRRALSIPLGNRGDADPLLKTAEHLSDEILESSAGFVTSTCFFIIQQY